LGAQASLPACFGQPAIAGSPQAGTPALAGYFCSFVARSDGKGRNRKAGFIFHFQYYICHLPLRAKAAPAMTNGKRKMENGKWKIPRNLRLTA
jgi:hypothetical protein